MFEYVKVSELQPSVLSLVEAIIGIRASVFPVPRSHGVFFCSVGSQSFVLFDRGVRRFWEMCWARMEDRLLVRDI